MVAQDYRKQIEGYDQILNEIDVLRRYGIDYSIYKGRKADIINRLHPKSLSCRVAGIVEHSSSVKTFRLVSVSNYLPPFQAGQYISVLVEIGGIKTNRPYSISSSPMQIGYYEITVKRICKGFVSDYLLDNVKVGDVLECTAPQGHFYYNPLIHKRKLVFLAGGSGITPFLSMIRGVLDRGASDISISLLYGCQKPEDAIYNDELLMHAKDNTNFSYNLIVSSPPSDYEGHKGYIDAKLIKELIPDIEASTVYLCGPAAMYKFCLPELQKLGVSSKQLRLEIFNPQANICDEPGWPEGIGTDDQFKVKLGERVILARAGEPLASTLELSHIKVRTCCRSGECSLCRIKLISGKVFQPGNVLQRKSDIQNGYIHSCQSYPISDVEIMI